MGITSKIRESLEAMQDYASFSEREIARRTGVNVSVVSRFLSGGNAKAETIDKFYDFVADPESWLPRPTSEGLYVMLITESNGELTRIDVDKEQALKVRDLDSSLNARLVDGS